MTEPWWCEHPPGCEHRAAGLRPYGPGPHLFKRGRWNWIRCRVNHGDYWRDEFDKDVPLEKRPPGALTINDSVCVICWTQR